jgi:predicted DNA-binding protein (UPF0251 family)
VNTLDELEAIRARHVDMQEVYGDDALCSRGHADRATLLRLLDAARSELAEIKEAAAIAVICVTALLAKDATT